MSYALSLILSLLLTFLWGLYVQAQWNAFRNERRDRYTLSQLQALTGIMSREALEDHVGRPGADELYEVPGEKLNALPRGPRWLRWASNPIGTVVAFLAALAALVETLRGGTYQWIGLGVSAGFVGVYFLVAYWLVVVCGADDEVEEESVDEFDGETHRRVGTVGAARHAVECADAMVSEFKRELDREQRHGGLVGWQKWLFGAMDRYVIRVASRAREDDLRHLAMVESEAETLQDHLEWVRHQLAEAPPPEQAITLRELETDLVKLLRELRGEATVPRPE